MADNENDKNETAETPREQAGAGPEPSAKDSPDKVAEPPAKKAKAKGEGTSQAKGKAKGKSGGGGGDAKKKGGKGGGDKGQAKQPAGPAKVYKREQPPRLKTIYEGEVREKLREEFAYQNPMQMPRLVKISLNMGLGQATQNPKLLDSAVEELRAISGRAPVVTVAKRDIATFKLRRGYKIGVMVTLRREAMWEFLDRLVNVALPRVRDFRGLSLKAFDGRGNYSIGIKEQIIFPEIEYDSIESVKGLNVTIVTTAKTDAEGRALLRHLGMPFRPAAGQAETSAQGAQA